MADSIGSKLFIRPWITEDAVSQVTTLSKDSKKIMVYRNKHSFYIKKINGQLVSVHATFF